MVLEIQPMVLIMENISWEIFGDTLRYGHVSKKIFQDGCVGPYCIDMAVARPIT
jgi:hypothetical protein